VPVLPSGKFPLSGTGHADYMLYAAGKAIGIVEAKPESYTLAGVEIQSAKYTTGFPEHLPRWSLPLPFAYDSTGTVTQFTSVLDPDSRSREVFAFHRPEELIRLAELGADQALDTEGAARRRAEAVKAVIEKIVVYFRPTGKRKPCL
jgi:type I restriction enzyme R subunit